MGHSEIQVAERMWGELHPFIKAALAEADAELAEITFEEIFNRLYGRQEALALKIREICNVVFLTALGKTTQDLHNHFMVAFRLGWTFREIREALILCALAAGWPAAIGALRELRAWCENNQKEMDPALPLRDGYGDTDWASLGRRTAESLFGAGEWGRYREEVAGLGEDLTAFTAENFVGKFLTRETLDARVRQMVLVAGFAALKSTVHLRLHLAGALSSGATPEELREILYQAGIYAGQEAVTHGAAVLRSVMAESSR